MHFFIFICINDCTYNNGGMYQNYYIRTSISFLRTGAGGSGRGWCGRDYNGDLLFDRKCDTMTMSSQKVLNFLFFGSSKFHYFFFWSSFLVVVVTGPGATCTESL
jgi:hypothetical protein